MTPRTILSLQLFTKRTGTIYRHQVERLAEKKNKRGKVIRVAREIPYTLEEFRAWVRKHFPNVAGGSHPEWVTRCSYCEETVKLSEFCVDHDVPLSRRGFLGLSNLQLCCGTCNRIKGEMSGKEYRQFRSGMMSFPEAARNDVFKRLKQGGGFARLRYMSAKKAEVSDVRP